MTTERRERQRREHYGGMRMDGPDFRSRQNPDRRQPSAAQPANAATQVPIGVSDGADEISNRESTHSRASLITPAVAAPTQPPDGDTPRSDTEAWTLTHANRDQEEIVSADFARTLERELAAAKAEVERVCNLHKGLMANADQRWNELFAHSQETAQSLAALQSEIADFEKSDEILSKQNHQLRTLIELIFASTLPYNNGEPTFSDKVTDAYHALFPNAKEPL